MAARQIVGELASIWLASGFLLRRGAAQRPGVVLMPGYPPTIVTPDWCKGGMYQEAMVAYAIVRFGLHCYGREFMIAELRAAGERWERDHHADTG